jgi:hypothetical protein
MKHIRILIYPVWICIIYLVEPDYRRYNRLREKVYKYECKYKRLDGMVMDGNVIDRVRSVRPGRTLSDGCA